MVDNSIENRMRELERLLYHHNEMYFDKDNPEITDREYDELSLELRKLESENPQVVFFAILQSSVYKK